MSVTSDVDPIMSFNVGTSVSCDETFFGNGGSVALGTIDTDAVTTSDVSGVRHICTRVTTNATHGANVTVKSLHAALVSTSVPADLINSETEMLLAGNEGYGLCVGSGTSHTGKDATAPAGSDPVAQSPFNLACDTSNHNVGGLTTSNQNIWRISGPSKNAYARIFVKASISPITSAHDDYSDMLTFIATSAY